MRINQVRRYDIIESNGIVSVKVIDAKGQPVLLEFTTQAASDMQGGLVRFHEEFGKTYRATKAAEAKRLIAEGVDRATVITRLEILGESWLDRALAGCFDLTTS